MRRRTTGRCTLVALVATAWLTPAASATSLRETIASAASRVVKIYGAGGVAGLEGYQSGVIVSPDGRIVTALSTVLDTPAITCVLDDGRRYPATLVGTDPRREIAVVTIDAADLPAFPLEAGERVGAGTRVFALSNMFGVATGDERVSVQHGVVAAVVPLEARRGAAETAFTGIVYLLDCTTNNPGAPGGAVVDTDGRLVGLLGKELRSAASGIWINYALPAAEVAAGHDEILTGRTARPAAPLAVAFDPRRLGLVLVPDLLDATPPFVEAVVPGSAAAGAGLRPDDLVIAAGGRSVGSRRTLGLVLGGIAAGDPVQLTIVRAGAIVDCDLGPRPVEADR